MRQQMVYFKNSGTGKSIQIELDVEMPLRSLRSSIHDKIKSQLGVNENYKIVKCHQPLLEVDSGIDENSDVSIYKLFCCSPMGFYITTLSYASTIPQHNCSICYNTFIRIQSDFSCGHHRNLCQQCITTWKECCEKHYKEITCPLCRSKL